MAARRTTKTKKKPHYVRNKKRKGADSAIVAKRTLAITVLIIFAGFILFGIFKGCQWAEHRLFSRNPRFNIQHLAISSDGNGISEDHVLSYIGVGKGVNLFSFKLEEIKEKLENEVPNIKTARLRRELPSTLYVHVVERRPIARINLQNNGRFDPIDADGVVMAHSWDTVLAQLPVIEGMGENWEPGDEIDHEDIDDVITILSLCESHSYLHDYIHIARIDVDHNDYIEIVLREGPVARMPRHSHEAKLYKLASAIDQSTGGGRSWQDAEKIDLTPDSASVFFQF